MSLRTAGLILAAGRGVRFGGGKMLAEIEGRPMLQHVLDLAEAAELDPVVVVLGADADAIESAISWRDETRLRNPDPDRGISSSVVTGLAAISSEERVLVLLGDQPLLTVEHVRVIIDAARDPSRPIVVPRYAGVPGNPVLLEREAWRIAQTLHGDRGMSQLFAAHQDLVRYVEVGGANTDIDTRWDLAQVTDEHPPTRRDWELLRIAQYEPTQRETCATARAPFAAPDYSKTVALGPLVVDGHRLVQGERYPADGTFGGWSLTASDMPSPSVSEMRMEHMSHVTWLRDDLMPYLGLPVGWAFEVFADGSWYAWSPRERLAGMIETFLDGRERSVRQAEVMAEFIAEQFADSEAVTRCIHMLREWTLNPGPLPDEFDRTLRRALAWLREADVP